MHYVIGDIHGCYDEMIRLIDKIEAQDADARFIFLGDFIDRGPKVWEALQWMMEHITPDGKYQSVIGNHEYMVCQWYRDCYLPRQVRNTPKHCPDTQYDFKDQLAEHTDFSEEAVGKIIAFFESLPTEIDFHCEENGLDFKIVHGWAVNRENYVSDEAYREETVWKRYYGMNPLPEIIVHGHTPTFIHDYYLRGSGDDRKGMICYRQNAINLDGGCVFHGQELHPCFLCGICLETLEEFYDMDIEDKIRQCVIAEMENWNKPHQLKEWIENHKDELDDTEEAVYEKKYQELVKDICDDRIKHYYGDLDHPPKGRAYLLERVKQS